MDFTLNFLPPGGLSSSVITTVWVGVMVVTFFNLRFGTTLSGLVVPGYLIPLFIVHPVSAWVIIVESILTYVLARIIADRGLVRLGLGEMFGRDRFFMLILLSVLVRIVSDGFILPELAQQLALWGAPYEVRSGLHSFGLIIIALCANQLWNGGIKIGGMALGLYLFVTYVIVVYLLMPYTNFNISTLGYMYEDIASSILASPKAYIILITAAYISSRMNLRYGWDFNGILIPSLLALQWYDPLKILATFIEALVILLVAQGVMQLPVIRKINIEGARQLLLFFNVGFCYKLLLGFAVVYWIPQYKVTDFYGFGYVLGTLMALKMYQKGIAIRFTRTTLQTSLVAVILASLLGYALTFFSRTDLTAYSASQSKADYQIEALSLQDMVENVRSQSYRSEDITHSTLPLSTELASFSQLFSLLKQLDDSPGTMSLNVIAYQGASLGYTTSWVEQRYLVLHDATPQRGWGIFIVDTQSPTQLALSVPRALDESRAAAVALPAFRALNARYLSYAGARATRAEDGSDDVLLNAQSPMQLFHQAVANNNALQLRSYTRSAARQLLGMRGEDMSLDLDISQSTVYVKRSLPTDLSLKKLEQLLGQFEINWHTPKTQNRQRDTAINGFAEVYLNSDSLLNIFTQALADSDYMALAKEQRIDGYLQGYLLEGRLDFAEKNSNSYVNAAKHELLYFDQAVLKSTLALVDEVQGHQWLEKHHNRLRQIAYASARFGYDVLLYRHISTDERYIIFQPFKDVEVQRHWGTYVVKVGPASEYLVEVPRPVFEQNTFEFGAQLFQALNARAMLISGAHPYANTDGSAQVSSMRHPDTLYNLFHQSLLSHYRGSEPFAVVVRGFKPGEDETANEALVAHFEYQKPGARFHPGLKALQQTLKDSGLSLSEPSDNEISERFEAKLNAQSRYTRFIYDAQYAEVWLPSLLREQYKRQGQDDPLAKKIAAVKLPLKFKDVQLHLSSLHFGQADSGQLAELKALLQDFEQSQNITALMSLKAKADEVEVLVDKNSGQYFMTFFDDRQRLLLVANLLPLNPGVTDHDITEFLDNRRHFLQQGGE